MTELVRSPLTGNLHTPEAAARIAAIAELVTLIAADGGSPSSYDVDALLDATHHFDGPSGAYVADVEHDVIAKAIPDHALWVRVDDFVNREDREDPRVRVEVVTDAIVDDVRREPVAVFDDVVWSDDSYQVLSDAECRLAKAGFAYGGWREEDGVQFVARTSVLWRLRRGLV